MIFGGFWEDFRNNYLRFSRDFGRILCTIFRGFWEDFRNSFLRFSGDFGRILGIIIYGFQGILKK